MGDIRKIKLSMSDLPDDFFKGKKAFIRVDYNVPISKGKIIEDTG